MVYILLDIDGVMVTAPSWKTPEILDDGFMQFNDNAARNLGKLLARTDCHLVITSTHRVHYGEADWIRIFERRALYPAALSKLDNAGHLQHGMSRCREIEAWYHKGGKDHSFIIIDDDSSLQDLPAPLKEKWVQTFFLKGFDDAAMEKAIQLLQQRQ